MLHSENIEVHEMRKQKQKYFVDFQWDGYVNL